MTNAYYIVEHVRDSIFFEHMVERRILNTIKENLDASPAQILSCPNLA